MLDEQKRRLLAFFGLLLPIGLVLFAMILNSDTDPLTLWVKKWETLLAAMIALLAAAFTLSQMRISDEKQEKRHRELVDLSLRADRLRAARAAYLAGHIREVVDAIPTEPTIVDDYAATVDFSNELVLWNEWAEKEFDHPLIKAAEDLFDAPLASHLEILRGLIVENLPEQIVRLVAGDNTTIAVARGRRDTDDSQEMGHEFADALEHLGRLYK